MTMDCKQCETCKFYTAESEEFGFCEIMSGLIVNPSDSCGDFEVWTYEPDE